MVKAGRMVDPWRRRPSSETDDEESPTLSIVGRSITDSRESLAKGRFEGYTRIRRSREESMVLGVSVAFLAGEFLEEIERLFGEGADPDYNEVNKCMLFGPTGRGCGYLCPRDGLPGCSYVDALDPCHVGQATVMLSWCWRYSVRKVVSAVVRWCERAGRDPARTFIWQCAVCCNQYRVEDKKARGESEPFEVFEEVFKNRVETTMHVIALLDPWDEPIYITRIWCIFELWTAVNTEGCRIEVVLPEDEELRFKDALRNEGMLVMWKALDNLKIQNAQATVEADRINILRRVDPEARTQEELEASAKCAEVNREVVQRLQAWCVDTAASHAESQIQAGNALGRSSLYAGNLLMAAAEWDRAEAILLSGLQAVEQIGAVATPGHIALLRQLADLRNRQGRHEEAAALMEQVIAAFESFENTPEGTPCVSLRSVFFRTFWDRRWEYAASLRSAGETAQLRGQLPEAVRLLKRSQRAYELAGGTGSTACAVCLTQIGACYSRQGRHRDAEELLTQVFEALDNDNALTPDDGELFKVYGRCRLGQGRNAEAMKLFESAKRIFEDTHAIRSTSYGELLLFIGSVHLEEDHFDEAKAMHCFAEAHTTMEAIGATSRAEYAGLPMSYGRMHLRMGDLDQAMICFEQAKGVLESAGAMEIPEYGCLLLFMGKCNLKQGRGDIAMQLFSQSKEVYEEAGAADAMAHLMLVNM